MKQWDPLKDLLEIQDKMKHIFEENVTTIINKQSSISNNTLEPFVDMYESDNSYVINVELPGIKNNDMELKLNKNTLVLEGEKKPNLFFKTNSFQRIERHYGKFKRIFNLPKDVVEEEIRAKFNKGILTITLPKNAKTKEKLIEIQ